MHDTHTKLWTLRGIVRKKFLELWPLAPAALFLLLFFLVVTTYLVGLSFSAVSHGETVFPTLETILAVWQKHEFQQALTNTLLFVLVGTPLELIVGLFLAGVLYRSFPGRNVIRSIILIPLAIPALVTAILLFIVFDFPGGHVNHVLLGKYSFFPAFFEVPINWRGSKFFSLGISLAGKVWRDMPISMLIILAGLNTVDQELIEAGRTMGARFHQRLRFIILPLIIPSLSAVLLLRSIEMWKEFIFPFVLAGQHALLGTLIESLYNNWGNTHEACTTALILVVCIIVTTLILAGLTEGMRRVWIGRWGQ